MIKSENGVFVLESQNTSYVFRVMETGHLEHLYYGKRINLAGDGIRAISQKRSNINGSSIVYDKKYPAITLDDVRLELSTKGSGDLRQAMIELVFADGTQSVDFLYDSYEITTTKHMLATLPSSYSEEGVETLNVILKERYHGIKLVLHYTVFEECDVIVRSATIINEGEDSILIEKILSAQLDIEGNNYEMYSFHGDWAKEMQSKHCAINGARVVNESRLGISSSRANPFVMIASNGTNEHSGECFGLNLIYSGSHITSAEATSHGKTNIVLGLNPSDFSWTLHGSECFETPEAVLTYSNTGFSGISKHMHEFVREHIVRGEWKHKPRPVLLNSWEASYFNFNESSLLKLARAGKDVGIELFVMDDGWFGHRDNDTSSLGDWYVNTKKLPGGIKGIAEKVESLGMMFGIWVEPEMISENSDLFRAHPDYAVRIPNQNHGEGRNQMILDLTRSEVQDYVIEEMRKVFGAGKVSYVKWDMNRNFSDRYSAHLENQKEFTHRYMLGLYRIFDTLTKEFPHILFEGCASGGNRFDLGVLCYMPQIWASDNSDAISRTYIQNGYSYGYPLSVIGAHVSNCPNHQTLRITPIESRFAVASFGLLGYECNLCEMKKDDIEAIKVQIEVYKKWRDVLQYGDFYRLGGRINYPSTKIGTSDNNGFGSGGNLAEWMVVSKDQKKAVGMMIQETVSPHTNHLIFRTKGLNDDMMYHFFGREMEFGVKRFGDLINAVAPIHVKQDSIVHNAISLMMKMPGEKEDYHVSGSILNNAGIELAQAFAGTGYNENTRLYQDFEARLYFMESAD